MGGSKLGGNRLQELENLVVTMVRGIVDHPDEVRLEVRELSCRAVIELHTEPRDRSLVIGSGGRVVTALRTIISSWGGKNGMQVDLDYATEVPRGHDRQQKRHWS